MAREASHRHEAIRLRLPTTTFGYRPGPPDIVGNGEAVGRFRSRHLRVLDAGNRPVTVAIQVESVAPGATWGVFSAEGDDLADLPAKVVDTMRAPGTPEWADAILILSPARRMAVRQERFVTTTEPGPQQLVAGQDIASVLTIAGTAPHPIFRMTQSGRMRSSGS